MPVELTHSPSLPALYAKAAAGLLPGRGRAGDTVPDTELRLPRVPVDRSRLAEYARVCGFRLTDTVPATYPQILAYPLTLSLLTQPEFPIQAVGAVHIANRIELRRPLDASEPLDLAVHAENLRPHPRGRQLDVVAVGSVAGVEVWRGVATYAKFAASTSARSAGLRSGTEQGALHRSGPEAGGRAESARAEPEREGPEREGPERAGPPAPTAVWRVGKQVGPAYAAVSGDRNPIHLSDLLARGFGFRRRIAHGMWTKARCLAQLAVRLPEAYEVDVTFRAPVLLPGTVGFSATASGAGWEFGLHDTKSGKPHLSGTVAALPAGAG